MTRETVGKIATDLLATKTDSVSPIDQTREQLHDYEKNVWECVLRGTNEFDTDFYVVVITKKEKLLENVLRNFFYPRLSCPTPDWDQTVYKFKKNINELFFMWTIPDKQTCEHLTLNAREVVKEEQELLRFVLAFNDGSLLKLAKDLNNEMPDSPELRDFVFKG